MMRFHTLIGFIKNNPWIWLVALPFLFNNKLIIAWYLIIAVVVSFLQNDIIQGFFTSTLLSLTLGVGKWYVIEIIPGHLLENEYLSSGYYVGWGIIPSTILIALTFALICRGESTAFFAYLKTVWRRLKLPSILIGLYFMFTLLSTINSPYPLLSLVHFSQQLGAVCVALIFGYLAHTRTENAKKLLYRSIVAIFIFQSVLSTAQFLKQGITGLAIEFPGIAGFSGGADQLNIFRPMGTMTNTNQYALLVTLLGSVILAKNLVGQKMKQVIAILLVWNIFITLSRSVWLGIGLGLLFNYKSARELVSWSDIKKNKAAAALALLLFTLFVPLMLQRLISSFQINSQYGGLHDRAIMWEEAAIAIADSPIIGTGVNTNELTLFIKHPNGLMSYFPTMVHNAYLQLAIDSGIPALIALLLGLLLLAKRTILKQKQLSLIKLSGILVIVFYLLQPHIDYIDWAVIALCFAISATTATSFRAIKPS